MKFKKMQLTNFRQFKDKVTIDFSTDKEKNVTVIIGDNGTGKTTLLQAFNWCFYNNLSGLENPTKLLNDNKLAEMDIGDDCEVEVLIEFEHLDRTYTCKNYKTYQKTGEKDYKCIESMQSFTKKELNGLTYKIDQSELNTIFPKDLSTYFLFDGERLVQLGENKVKGRKDLSKAVTDLLGLDVIINTKAHLETAKKQFENEFVSDNTERLEQIRYLLEQYDEKIETAKTENKKLEDTKNDLENKLDKKNEELKGYEKLKDLQEKRREYDERKAQNEKDIEECRKNIYLSFGLSMPSLFLNNTIKELQEKIKHTKLNGKSIQGIHGIAIEEILKRGKCICGCNLNENQEAVDNLKDLINYILPNDYSGALKGFETSLKNMVERNSEFVERFDNLYKSYNKYIERNVNIENAIDENEKKISSIGDKDLEEQNKEYLHLKNLYIENNQKIGENKGIIASSQNEQQKLSSERSRLAVSNDVNDAVRKKVEICEEFINDIDKRLTKKKTEIREKMQKYVSLIFEAMLPNNDINSKKSVVIDDDYSFAVLDKFGTVSVLSEGEKIIISFAFVSALISCAKEILIYNSEDKKGNNNMSSIDEDDKVFSLVMDAPFAKLDESNSEGISKTIPKLTDQIILFSVDKQWNGIIKESLIDKVGLMYEMNRQNGDTSIEKKEVQ